MFDDFIKRRNRIIEGSGQKGIESQHSKGKRTARERIQMLLDKDSFIELDVFVKHRSTSFNMMDKEIISDGVITGYGTINKKLVYIYSQDFTLSGGSLGEMHAQKITKVQQLALKNGAPIIGINDSGGARVQEGIDSLAGFGNIFYQNVKASGVIPQITIILGPCAGGAVYSPALMDFIFTVDNVSKLFITGPDVIEAVTGEKTTQETLGGARTHSTLSGVSHFMYQDEASCFEGVRELLGLLPSNYRLPTPKTELTDSINRRSPILDTIIPESITRPYEIKDIITEISDHHYFFEVQSEYAKNAVIGFIKLAGKTVGVVANNPRHLSGCVDINASDKIARFVRTCDCFNIPILTLQDVPGFLPGVNQEHNGIIRHGAKILFAYSEASVPMITLIVRKAYGGSYIALGSKHLGADFMFAWPSARIAVMGADGAVNIIHRHEIRNSDNPQQTRLELVDAYEKEIENPYASAERGYVDDIIMPSNTRQYLISAFDSLSNKKIHKQDKKHGNIPL